MGRDLSLQHEPIGAFFPQPRGREEWESHRLGDEQVAFFHEHGYVSGVRVLDERQLAVLRAETEAARDLDGRDTELLYEHSRNESADRERRLFHCLGHWRVFPAFHDLIFHPAITVPASQLLSGAVRFWHDQLFVKPPLDGGVVAWHQDYSYWTRTRPMAHLTVWIGLDQATRENGCLHYVPGSHRWPLLPKPALAGDIEAIRSVLSNEQNAQFQPVAIPLRAGYASLHHPLLLHGSYENWTSRPRRAAVVNFVRDGVASMSDAPLLDGVPPVPQGWPLGGQFFPLLLDPEAAWGSPAGGPR